MIHATSLRATQLLMNVPLFIHLKVNCFCVHLRRLTHEHNNLQQEEK